MNKLTSAEKATRRAAMRARAEKLLEQAILEVRVDRLVEGGLGFCHVEGFPLLIARSAPGDLLRVRISDRKKDYARAEIVEVVEPGPDRVDAPCDVYDRCGGCDLQHIRVEKQIQIKVAAAMETLRRLGGVEVEEPEVVTGAAFGYRSRAQLQVRGVGRELDIGFFERGSKNLVATLSCPVLVSGLEKRLGVILQALRQESEQPTKDDRPANDQEDPAIEDKPEVQKVSQAEEGGLDDQGSEEEKEEEVLPKAKALPSRIDLLLGDDDELTTAPAIEALPHRPVVRRVGEFEFELDARCFFQGHDSLVEKLVAAAVGDTTGDAVFELHSGVGLFTLHLAKKYGRVYAAESDRLAVRYLRRNAKRNKILNIEVSPTSAEHFLRDWQSAGQSAEAKGDDPPPRADRWFFDPPRTGLTRDLVHAVCRARPQRITYVSCQPPTLARDLKRLHRFYVVEELTFVDLFPQTAHLETVVQLRARAQALPAPPKPEPSARDGRGDPSKHRRSRDGRSGGDGRGGAYAPRDRSQRRGADRPSGGVRRNDRPPRGGDRNEQRGTQQGPWGGPGGSRRPRGRTENKSFGERPGDKRSGETRTGIQQERGAWSRAERPRADGSGDSHSSGYRDSKSRPDGESVWKKVRENGPKDRSPGLGGGWAKDSEPGNASSREEPRQQESRQQEPGPEERRLEQPRREESGRRQSKKPEPRKDETRLQDDKPSEPTGRRPPLDDPWANARVPKHAPKKTEDDS